MYYLDRLLSISQEDLNAHARSQALEWVSTWKHNPFESFPNSAVLVVYTDCGEVIIKWYMSKKGAKIGAHARARYRAYLDGFYPTYWRFVVVTPHVLDWGVCDFREDPRFNRPKDELNSFYGVTMNQSRKG